MIIQKQDFLHEGSEIYEEGLVLSGSDCYDFLDEATGKVPLNTSKDIDKDFKKMVLKAVERGYQVSSKGIGIGLKDAFFDGALRGLFSPFLKKTKEKIENGPDKNSYILIIPQKLRVMPDASGRFKMPKEYDMIAKEMIKATGMKKGGVVKNKNYEFSYFYKYSSDKKRIYISFYSAPATYYMIKNQLQIFFRCCDNTDIIRKEITESASIFDNLEKKAEDRFTMYFDIPEDEDFTDSSEEDFYRDPIFNKAITEHFDLRDRKTCRYLTHINEANQNSVLMSLTSKLYDKIVEKCDDIDYGEIPNTKGDITKLSKYESMKETISIMHDLLKEYNQDTGPIDELSVAFSNVETRKDLFERAFRYNSELPIAMYCNIVLGIITGISYMIATCIEFIKDPGTTNFRISLDKTAYAKTKDHMIYNTLKSFNKTCKNGEFDKAMEAVLKSSTRNFGGAAIAGGIAIGVFGTILVLIPVLRELIFMFYYMRMKVSDFFDIQADLLQVNAYSIDANSTMDEDDKKKIMNKQLKYVERFRKISNTFAIDIKKAEVEADKEKKSDDETKMLIDDIDGIDTGSNVSALF